MSKLRPKAERNPFKERTRKTIAIALAVAVLIIGIVLYYYNKKEEPLLVSYPVCELEQVDIIKEFEDYNFTEKLNMQDYFFYGETLSIFEEEYDIQEKNSLLGKTIVIENICTKDEYFYLIDEYVDGQIPLEQLPEGVYEVFINIDLIKKRVVVDEKLSDSINLVRRNGQIKTVDIIADKNIFDDRENKNYLNDNYLFLNVKENEETVKDYDIVIDPEHGTNITGWFTDMGSIVDDMVEADELYAMANQIKTELEKTGLKVLVTRKSAEEIVNVYGEDGRLNRAYDSGAKYYIELGWGTTALGGLKIYNSSFSSIQFAGSIANHLLLETDLESQNTSGVYTPQRYNGLDGIITIREIGGKALSAATFSDKAIEGNASFALNNRHALEALSIEFLSANNEKQITRWKKNKEVYAKETATAILNFLDIGEDDDLSD